MTARIPWKSGSLWERLKAQSAHGLETGYLRPIKTTVERIETGDISFLVYVLANILRKEEAKAQQGKTASENPFLPYEQDLYVTDISETHLCLLNKFNVVDHHFLIVTREFEHQDNWLTMADFDALRKCLSEVDGLGYYNGGTAAGASQPHKHLQVIPRSDELAELPVEIAMTKAKVSGGNRWSPLLPFKHAIAKFPPQKQGFSGEVLTKLYMSRYLMLLNAVGIDTTDMSSTQTAPYNLLCTRQWMMLIPRSQEKYADISVNSLGFAGSLLVKDEEELTKLQEIGPLTLLEQVGYAQPDE